MPAQSSASSDKPTSITEATRGGGSNPWAGRGPPPHGLSVAQNFVRRGKSRRVPIGPIYSDFSRNLQFCMKIIDRRRSTLDRRTVRPRVKEAAAVYGTPEYRAWALAVKERAGWKCEVCGTRQGRLYADHIVEIEDGGAPFDDRNGQCLCHAHHQQKTARERAKRARS